MTLGNNLQGHSRSLTLVPFDRPHTISYWTSIESMSLFCTVFEILTLINLRICGSADRQINAIAAPDVKLAVGPSVASRCDKRMAVSNSRRRLLFHVLDRNEINNHRVAETGWTASGRPAGIPR